MPCVYILQARPHVIRMWDSPSPELRVDMTFYKHVHMWDVCETPLHRNYAEIWHIACMCTCARGGYAGFPFTGITSRVPAEAWSLRMHKPPKHYQPSLSNKREVLVRICQLVIPCETKYLLGNKQLHVSPHELIKDVLYWKHYLTTTYL